MADLSRCKEESVLKNRTIENKEAEEGTEKKNGEK